MVLPVIRHVFSGLNRSVRPPRPRARKQPGAATSAARTRIPSDPRAMRREHGMTSPDTEARMFGAVLAGYLERVQNRLRAELRARLAAAPARGDAGDPPREDLTGVVHEFGVRTATRNAREFRRVFGLNARELEPGISKRIDRFRARSLGKIRSLETEQVAEFGKILDEGLAAGAHADAIAAKVEERFGVTRSKARLLARDQILTLNAEITKDRQERAGVVEYVWITAHDDRVRGKPDGKYPGARNHWRLHGTTQRWDSPPVTDESTGRRAHPGEDVECRCVAVPKIPELTAEDEALFAAAVGDE